MTVATSIQGVAWYGGTVYDTKKEAQTHAKRARKRGYKTKIMPLINRGKKGYCILTRK